MTDQLESRIRDVLRARAGATVVAPPSRFTPGEASPRSRRWLVPVGVASVGATAAAVVALVVVVAGTDDSRTVLAGPDAPASPGSTPTGPAPAADPVLGPLPYLLLDDPTLSVISIDATVGPPVATGPDTGDAGWHVQSYESAAGLDGPRVQVLTVPYLDADGPDDIGHTYGDADTERVTVQGEPANLLTRDRFAGLWWPGGGDGGVLLSAWDVAADELVALADGLVARSGGGAGGWDASTLPSGLALAVDAPRGSDVTVPWWSANVQYVRAGVEGTGPSLSISTGGAVAFADMTAPSPFQSFEPVTVAGRPGALIAMADGADHRLLWRHSDTTIGEVWAMGTSRDEVVAMAAAIREVGEDEWVASLPVDTLTPAGQADLLAALAPGTPLPAGSSWDGFLERDASSSPGADAVLVGRRDYPFLVALHAACEWQLAWLAAAEAGDAPAAGAAVDALRTSGSWSAAEALAAVIDAGRPEGMVAVDPGQLVHWARVPIEAGDVEAARAEIQSSCSR